MYDRIHSGRWRIEEPPYIHPTIQAHQEFKGKASEVASKLDELMEFAQALRDKPSVNKADRDALISKIRMARQSIASDMPFATKCYQETIERATTEAKGEIDAHLLRIAHELGVESLKASLVELPSPNNQGESA